MKNVLLTLRFSLFVFLLVGISNSARAIAVDCRMGDVFHQPDDGPVSRTYLSGSTSPTSVTRNWKQERRRPETQGTVEKSSADVVITYQDFQNHLAVGQDRIIRIIDLQSSTISMDVGTEGLATGQVWNLPNLSPAAYPQGQTTTYSSVAVTSTPNYESFTSEDVETGVVTNPAAAYEISSGFYQYLDFFVSEFEGEVSGTLDNLGYDRNGDIFGFYATLAPLPLSLNSLDLDVEILGELCAFFNAGCETGNSDEETFDLRQTFEVVASGTLNTYDGESSEGIKLRNTDVFTFYDNNGQVIEIRTIRYVIWYTKAGHFVRAALNEGAAWTGTTEFVYFEYQKLSNTALPVEWLAINAEAVKNSEVKVSWSTATETDNERFIVQRSEDGERFTSVGWLDAVGNSEVRQDYSFTDEAPLEGFNYYRVRQQDLNGMDTYSSIVSALITRTADDEELIVLYPNPGRNEVFFSRPADYELMTINGQVLTQGRVESQLDVAGLPAGTYLVRIDGGEAYRWVKR